MAAVLRRVFGAVAAVLAVLALPAAVAAYDARAAFASVYAPADPAPVRPIDPPVHDPARRTAVVVVGMQGAAVSDVLAPYEALAATGAFNVYVVAPRRHPVPLTGSLDLLPDLDFAGLDARLGGAAPDLVVVPAVPDVGTPSARPLEEWAARQMGRTLMVSVCNGSGVLAAAGLLDGRRATAHWTRIDAFERQYPAVAWQRGARWVDDGDLISTAGILSGVDGTLHAIDRLIGPGPAATAAAAIGWTPRPVAQEQHTWRASDAIVVLNAGYRWDPERIGVPLTDGVGETALAAVFDTYGGHALATRTIAVGSAPGAVVRSRHGLVFLPRAAAGSADVDRIVEPVAGGNPFDAVLRDVAAHVDVPTARWVARAMEYPDGELVLDGPGWPAGLIARPILLAMVGGGIVVAVLSVRRRRTRATVAA